MMLMAAFNVMVMLADMDEWAEMNRIYMTFFLKHLPARRTFGPLVWHVARGSRSNVWP